MNNRKQTRGRIIQQVRVPEYKVKRHHLITGQPIYEPNLHPNTGKTIQIKHVKKPYEKEAKKEET